MRVAWRLHLSLRLSPGGREDIMGDDDGSGDWLRFLIGMKYAGKVAREMGAEEAGKEMEETADEALSCLGTIILVPVLLVVGYILVALAVMLVVAVFVGIWEVLCSPWFWLAVAIAGVAVVIWGACSR